jgi:alpha-L-rhamnosidase
MTAPSEIRIASLTLEHLREPLGIGSPRPRLTWTVPAGAEDWSQTGYEIEVADPDEPARPVSTGRVSSAESVLVPWPAAELISRQRRLVRVRVWGTGGRQSAWSGWTQIEAGLLSPADWQARAISPPPHLHRPPPGPGSLLRHEFRLAQGVRRARLYATAHGLFDIRLNARPAGADRFAPGWTSYHHRLRYQTYDVTDLVRPGENAIAVTLADGWYRGRLGFGGGRTNVYGDRVAVIAQLEVAYADGGTALVTTGDGWRCGTGPILSAGLYEGERADARREPPHWASPGFDDADWAAAEVLPHDPSRLVAATGPPVREVAVLAPVATRPGNSGGSIVDFGQNIAGHLRIRVRGAAGQTVTLRHAEELEEGELATRPLRSAVQTDEYTLRGDATPEVWQPRFTIHGFRYAHLDGWPGEPGPGDVEAVVCHTDMRRTGWFECSDPLLNRLHENVVWSMRGNFVDLPTDCPQRDERLGWTGDIQVFAPTAAFLYDCAGVLTSWLADLAAEQREYGTVPHYVPWLALGFPLAPAAAWGDAAVLVPWVMYQRFGDAGLLRRQYPSMTGWAEQVAALAGPAHRWESGFQFGDWLDPAAPPNQPGAALTDRHLVATAYHAHTTQILAEVARTLGEERDHRRYLARAEAIRRAFTDEYVTPRGRLSSDTQTGYALALQFDLLPGPEQRERAGRRLAQLVAAAGYRIATGFVGTPLICDALTAAGEVDVAYRLLLQTECPSWLYPVTMGATTIWERWDSRLPDGRINPGEMTSFNHYAFGAVADWLHRTVAGLAPAAPGYRRILVEPRPGGGLTRARAEHDTPYGRAAVSWTRTGPRLRLTVTVPPGTRARVSLPAGAGPPVEVGSGTHAFDCAVRSPGDDPLAGGAGGVPRTARPGPPPHLPGAAAT